MSDNRLAPGVNPGNHGFKEAVCVMTEKVYDSCKDKDCLESLQVYLPRCSGEIVERAINIRCKKAEIIWVYSDVEAVPFNRGYYSVDSKFFFKITMDAFLGVGRPTEIEGLATFDKKVILFGSEGSAKIFTSDYVPNGSDRSPTVSSNLPRAVVEAVDPICLGLKVVEHCFEDSSFCLDSANIPDFILNKFGDNLLFDGNKRILVTLGLFTIIKLVRSVQLLIPSYDFCIPEKTCIGPTEEDPCSFFSKIKFPYDEFNPPRDLSDEEPECGCNSND